MIDTSVQQPIFSLPIAFGLDDQVQIKLCQKMGDGKISMISVNKTYDPIIIDPYDTSNFKIHGAVVWHAHSWI